MLRKQTDEDRFDPYGAPSAKRRAVSPSISHLKSSERSTERPSASEKDPSSSSSHSHSYSYSYPSSALVSPIIIPRSPILRPRKSFSQSAANSATSSPTISQSSASGFCLPYPSLSLSSTNGNGHGNGAGHHRSGSASSVVSSPTVRSSLVLASPILRPVPRLAAGLKRAAEEEERIVDGTGENLKELNIS